jgi:predicted ATPase
MLREMSQALDALAAEEPLVLLLEDLHWSDFSTLELLAAIARRSERAKIMVIGTYRPAEIYADDHPLGALKQELQVHRQCEELPLKLLDRTDIQEYLEKRLIGKGKQPLDALAPIIYARTDGNPLFMVNMIDYLLTDKGPLGVSREASKVEWVERLPAASG